MKMLNRLSILATALFATSLALAAVPARAEEHHDRDRRGWHHDRGGWYHDRDHWDRDRHDWGDDRWRDDDDDWGFGFAFASPPPVYSAPPPPAYHYYPYGPVAAAPASPIYRTPDGQYCREYQRTIWVNGHRVPSYGTACLEPDGQWRMVN